MGLPVTVKLRQPITIGSETIFDLTVGDIKGKHMRTLPADPKAWTMGTVIDMAQRITGQPSLVFDEMGADDLLEVCSIVGERLGAGQAGGMTT